jgi:peptidyl-prolyl cis-trans isomerase C
LKMNTAKWIMTGLLLVVCLSCAQEERGEGLARVGDYVITEQTLQKRLESMPPFMKEQVSTPEGKQRFLEAIVEEEVIVREDEMRLRERDMLVRLFYDKVVMPEAAPSDSQITAYYEAHLKDYTIPEHAIARHILLETRSQALEMKKQIEAGADFGEMAREHSLDAQTKMREGLFHGRVERGAPIRGLGDFPELTDAILALEPGKVSDPIKTDLGYHLVRVDEHNPATVKPLEEVRKDITSALANAGREGARDRILAELKSKYNVVYLSESQPEVKSPEELFKTASEETNPQKKIEYYQEFIDNYPDNERAYEAKFMVGFTLAEELGDFDRAEKTFKEFLQKYPENDLTDDANWMLENMRSGNRPDFDSN